ncbi:HAD hydrolase family protein [Georgenia sp. Z1491]|uniref:HAD hydrolase family protein n=1 Tax=Georgenia sp. Z1491 TaxID=3416707 RepID=UPI003CE90985
MLAPETLAGVRAVGLDVDGTISRDDHTVSARTAAAISRVAELGVPVFLLTGRARRNTLELATRLGLTNLVASNNGSITFDPVTNADVALRPMDRGEVRDLLDLGTELGLEVTWWTTTDIYVSREGDCADMLRMLGEDGVVVGDTSSVPPVVTKTMLFGTAAQLDAATPVILARNPRGTRSMDEFFEFVAEDANKWHALEDLLGRYGIAAGAVLGMGDGGNDVPWLTRIGIPVAVGNAREEVKVVASAVAPANSEDGVAVVLEALADQLSGELTARSPR